MAVRIPASLRWASPTDALLLRICASAWSSSEPGFRASGNSRFDDPLRKFETLYCAASFMTCYSETMLRDGTFNEATLRYEVSRASHDSRSLTLLAVDLLQLKLVDMFSHDGLRRMGWDAALGMGDYKTVTQPLARALYEHPDAPDGIVYHSRLSPQSPAMVFFDRARPHVRLFPKLAPTPLPDLREAFDAVSRALPIALV